MTICADCKKDIGRDGHLTEINPVGGYDRAQVLICDQCMSSGRWNGWKSQHWQNWPEEPRVIGNA